MAAGERGEDESETAAEALEPTGVALIWKNLWIRGHPKVLVCTIFIIYKIFKGG